MLHLETVTPALLKIIRAVSAEPLFEKFRLVGGTALSLQLGHRMSIDADFFSNEDFDKDAATNILSIIQHIAWIYGITKVAPWICSHV